MKNTIRLLSNWEIYQLSTTMKFSDLVAKVHETQPGLTQNGIRRIVKMSRPTTLALDGGTGSAKSSKSKREVKSVKAAGSRRRK